MTQDVKHLGRLVALGFAVVAELTAGPLLGYVFGKVLTQYFSWGNVMVSLGVCVGFLLGVLAVFLTIQQMFAMDSVETGKKDI